MAILEKSSNKPWIGTYKLRVHRADSHKNKKEFDRRLDRKTNGGNDRTKGYSWKTGG